MAITAMGAEGVKREDIQLEMGLEDILSTLSSMSLASVTIGEFLVVMKSDFDLIISGEPYTGLVLLLNLTTGKFLSRIWNQSVATGTIGTVKQLVEACENHFGQGRPCLGRPEEVNNKHGEFIISQTPVPRRIATACLKGLGKGVNASVSSCSECTKLACSAVCEIEDFSEDMRNPNYLEEINKNEGDGESITSLKKEYANINVEEDMEKLNTKSQLLNTNDNGDWNYSKENESKNFKCEQCPCISTSKSDLKRHIKQKHENIKKHICEECGYNASKKSHLMKHIDGVHKKKVGEKWPCGKCGLSLTCKWSLKKHIEVVHEKVKNHVCDECGKAFAQRGTLKMHIQGVHKKIRNHVCGECGYKALHKGNLKIHIECVHEKTNQYVCEECGHTTSQKSHLQKHIQGVHEKIKNLACKECGTTFFDQSHLNSHMKCVHEKIKDHVCNECGYSASQKGNLKQHIEHVHQKIKTHVCDECGYATSRKKYLIKHRECAHSLENLGTGKGAVMPTHIKTIKEKTK